MACRRVLSKCPLPYSLLKTTRQTVEGVNYLPLHKATSSYGHSISSNQRTTADSVRLRAPLNTRKCKLTSKTRHLQSLRIHGNHPILSNIFIYSTMSPLPVAKGNYTPSQQHPPTLAAKATVDNDMEESPSFRQPVASSPALFQRRLAPLAAGLPLADSVCWYQPLLWQPMAGHNIGRCHSFGESTSSIFIMCC